MSDHSMNPSLSSPVTSKGRFVTLRLRPGEEVLGQLVAFVVAEQIRAAALVSAVGSLTRAAIRFANQPDATILTGHFEVCALSGTLECADPGVALNGLDAPGKGAAHVHLAISDGEGRMTGGHMMLGCEVYTTLEIVLLVLEDQVFTREHCDMSGYPELVIRAAGRGAAHNQNKERG